MSILLHTNPTSTHPFSNQTPSRGTFLECSKSTLVDFRQFPSNTVPTAALDSLHFSGKTPQPTLSNKKPGGLKGLINTPGKKIGWGIALALAGIPVSLMPPFLFGIPFFLAGGGLAIVGLFERNKASKDPNHPDTPNIHSGLPLSDYDRGQLDLAEKMQNEFLSAILKAEAETAEFAQLPIKKQMTYFLESIETLLQGVREGDIPIQAIPFANSAVMISEEKINSLIKAIKTHHQLLKPVVAQIPDNAASLLELNQALFTQWTHVLFEGLHSHCVPFENYIRNLVEGFATTGKISNDELHRVLKAPVNTPELKAQAKQGFTQLLMQAADNARKNQT